MNCMPSLKSSLRVVHERRPIKSGLKPPPPLPPSTSQSMTSSSHEVPEQIGSLGERCRSNPTIARSPPTELVSLSFLFSNNNFYSRSFRNFPRRLATRKLRCYDLNAQRQRVLSYRIGQIQQRSEKELDFLSIKNIYSLKKLVIFCLGLLRCFRFFFLFAKFLEHWSLWEHIFAVCQFQFSKSRTHTHHRECLTPTR